MIQTERLNIYPVTDGQMREIIDAQTVPELKAAYQEMLSGCLAYPEQRQWYALWNMELRQEYPTVVGNLSFKGLGADGAVEIGYGTNEGYECRGYMTEAVTALTAWALEQPGVTAVEAEARRTTSLPCGCWRKQASSPPGRREPRAPGLSGKTGLTGKEKFRARLPDPKFNLIRTEREA